MLRPSDSVIVVVVGRFMAPFVQIFALYVIAHGHYSPGGGFQGGAMLGASVLLLRLCVGERLSHRMFPSGLGVPLSSLGVLVFAGVGLVALAGGGAYLDYAALPIAGMAPAALRSLGILLVETGVGIGVMATFIGLFDLLARDHESE
ncbi:MAG: sodium:proton antiporter [Planctomycetes bacterium]|nr:sodium:proton antiporter [Planctomycetota bacterium]MBM4083226.1 sodium:proton antiporter [Planctomycetota bacterium]